MMNPERAEYHPMPSEPDRGETPAAKNKRLRAEREALQAKIGTGKDKEQKPEAEAPEISQAA